MTQLCDLKCTACRGEEDRMAFEDVGLYAARVSRWRIVNAHHLFREYLFPDFAKALAFVNKASAVAEGERHHPTITFTWGRVGIEIHTFKVDGLTRSDFVLAAKIDKLDEEPDEHIVR